MCRACPIPFRALAYLGGFACTTPEYLCDVQVSQFDQVGVTVKMVAKDSSDAPIPIFLTDANTNTKVSKISDTDAYTDTLVFTDHFYLELVHTACTHITTVHNLKTIVS